MNPLESRASSHPLVEPLDDWVLVQPTMEEEAVGRIVLPANMTEGRLERSIVLAIGSEVSDLQPGDVVLPGRCSAALRGHTLVGQSRLAIITVAKAVAARRHTRKPRPQRRQDEPTEFRPERGALVACLGGSAKTRAGRAQGAPRT